MHTTNPNDHEWPARNPAARMKHSRGPSARRVARCTAALGGIAAAILVLAGCTSVASNSGISDSPASTENSTTAGAVSTAAALATASWGSNVTVTIADGMLRYVSDGIPNHPRQKEYALPAAGGAVPTAATAVAQADPTRSQSYDFKITTTPVLADSPTPASLGTIGVMISGAALFNPYEGDGTTVAIASNFTVPGSDGKPVAFLDSCNGHPNPMGAYHYHGLPTCVTATVDKEGGPSHIIGVAFDGFPIYGDRDITGAVIPASRLDQCNGITSETPEFPEGIYHYVLLDVADSTSSIKCFSGVVDPSLTKAAGQMPGMGGGAGPGMDGVKPAP